MLPNRSHLLQATCRLLAVLFRWWSAITELSPYELLVQPQVPMLLRILHQNAGKAMTIDLADTHRAKLQSSTASTLPICLLCHLTSQWLDRKLQHEAARPIMLFDWP